MDSQLDLMVRFFPQTNPDLTSTQQSDPMEALCQPMNIRSRSIQLLDPTEHLFPLMQAELRSELTENQFPQTLLESPLDLMECLFRRTAKVHSSQYLLEKLLSPLFFRLMQAVWLLCLWLDLMAQLYQLTDQETTLLRTDR